MNELERMFPVLLSAAEKRQLPDCPRSIPWRLLAPHEAQAQKNHYQSLERLADRGGLGLREIVYVVRDQEWPRDVSDPVGSLNREALEFVKELAGR